jgi:hypothetical protein
LFSFCQVYFTFCSKYLTFYLQNLRVPSFSAVSVRKYSPQRTRERQVYAEVLSLILVKENELIRIESFTKEQLVAYLQALISKDFAGLVQLLYRLDISEAKLKQTLASHADQDAGLLIAEMIIDRLEQKKKAREEFDGKDWGGSEEERW